MTLRCHKSVSILICCKDVKLHQPILQSKGPGNVENLGRPLRASRNPSPKQHPETSKFDLPSIALELGLCGNIRSSESKTFLGDVGKKLRMPFGRVPFLVFATMGLGLSTIYKITQAILCACLSVYYGTPYAEMKVVPNQKCGNQVEINTPTTNFCNNADIFP